MSAARPRIDRGAAVLGLLTIIAANCIHLAGLPAVLDPMLATEPLYIDIAQQPVIDILGRDPGWGPLYALWLKPLRALLGDPLTVYTANIYALSLGVSLCLYLYLLLLTRRVAIAAAAALFFLISDFNVPLPTKASSFAVMVVLAGLALSELVRVGARRTSVAAIGVLLASYARPELYPAAVCLCVAAVWLARGESRAAGGRVLIWPAGAFAAIAVTALSIGTPVFSPHHASDRLLAAFREHFAWNWVRWHAQWRSYLAIWNDEFGGAQSTVGALLTNPAVVARHLADNVVGMLRFLAESAFAHYPLLAPATWPALVKAENLLAAAAVLGGLLLVALRPALRHELRRRYGHVLLPYLTLATFSLGAATVIYPVSHYLMVPAILLLLSAALVASLLLPAWPVASWRLRIAAALVCLAAVPRPFVLPSAYVVPGSPFLARIGVSRTITDTIEFIRGLDLPPPVQVLTLSDGIGEMLGAGFVEVKAWKKGPDPLEAYLRDNGVDVIVTMEPGLDSFVLDDPYWRLIQLTPDAAGFAQVPVPNHGDVRVFVRRDDAQHSPDGAHPADAGPARN